jgi:hypothetical protein
MVIEHAASASTPLLVEIAPEVKEVLEATFQDAARVISPAGLRDYLRDHGHRTRRFSVNAFGN